MGRHFFIAKSINENRNNDKGGIETKEIEETNKNVHDRYSGGGGGSVVRLASAVWRCLNNNIVASYGGGR